MNARSRKTLILTLGLIVGFVFLWLAVRGTNLTDIRESFLRANWLYAPVLVLVLCIYFVVKTVRWRYLLLPFARIRTSSLIPVVVVGYASNLLLPAQMGELVRTFLARQKYGIATGPILVTVIVERMFDFLTILLFVGIILLTEDKLPPELLLAGYVCGAVGIAMLAGIALQLLWPRAVESVINVLTRFLPNAAQAAVAAQYRQATAGLRALEQPQLFFAITLSSVAQWLLMGLCAYIAIFALDLDVPFSAAFVVLAVIVVGMTIPSSPGFFGTIQLCFTIGLAAYGIETDDAVAASIYFHGLLFISVALAGALFVRYLGYSPGDLIRNAEEQQP